MPDDPPPEPPSADPAQPSWTQPPEQAPQPSQQADPFGAVWSMSPVADARAAGRAGRRRSDLRLGAGLVGGLLIFFPFGLIATILWGWWEGEANWGSGGWVNVLIGAAAGFAVGAVVASSQD
ncbi:hypothetical protein [Actinophytocola xanthii]|uniref:Uncharacterized protein n=1 Tax=Actinophytocola xanthii TaxID=1912961 RepID=A0A1Q8CML0_9PSEU|nr:hypothetical protein [Actinophytocola xanthii]OLF15596.1 hypothetical protein BU204_21000 [Actinophytocola xanthii]